MFDIIYAKNRQNIVQNPIVIIINPHPKLTNSHRRNQYWNKINRQKNVSKPNRFSTQQSYQVCMGWLYFLRYGHPGFIFRGIWLLLME